MTSVTLWRDRVFFWFGLAKGKKASSFANLHSEAVYREFVYRESKRSARSGHLCRILLVYHTNAQGRVVPFGSDLADKTLSVLSSSCRDTDYIGWYQRGRILGVLITALRPDSVRDGCDNLMTRLVGRLRAVLTFADNHSLQIRVLEQSEVTAFCVSNHSAPAAGS